MGELVETHYDRMAGLYEALAPMVIELDADDNITLVVGKAGMLLNADENELMSSHFEEHLHEKDLPIWRLLRHKITQVKHIGPLPLRLRNPDDKTQAFEVIVARCNSVAGRLHLSLTPYQGKISFGESRRPSSNAARNFSKDDFSKLAKKLTAYGEASSVSATEALLQLAGVEDVQDSPESNLMALYSLLHSAASEEIAAVKRKEMAEEVSKERPSQTKETNTEVGMKAAVRGAYQKTGSEVNYVTVGGEDGISEQDAVKAAVYAMKKAATSGGVRTMEALTGGYEKRLETVRGQLKAFKKIVLQERFEIALQPIVNIADGSLHHFEALTRFDNEYYSGTPYDFMRFAEGVGVIQEFDLAMVMKCVSLLKRMKRMGYNIGVAVNLSGRSIQSPSFLRHFFRILEDCSDIRDLLMFELTESSQIDDLETTNSTLSRIRDFGHKVALDDFGAGAAGIQYLRVLKVDVVKIDGIYIRKGIENQENRSFLRSMAELCNGLGIETVGECVENEEQRDFLSEIGITYAQGWLYGKPLPVDEALKAIPSRYT
ncbi:EAL domain-containing protein [Kordiimonas sp. SCSIO 12603]|uniref:EAL domain-containing protein n=1 Tax=Kordiimonas sp. SCSIO 12603 TaxID=2829596 RepID=UPI002101FEAF|nr:EAL domain-containing protein [Kordiimonas sp. SCSIO 12603]UTW57766.1 EAL domain-containing protein [Kordiimonas sp. SCSIO 12603]